MTYRSRIDLGVAATVIAIGAVFAVEAWRIDPASYEAVGPRSVPVFLAVLMIALGAIIAIGAVAGGAPEEEAESFGFRNSDVRRVLSVIAVGAICTAIFWAAGYMVAMIVGTGLMLWVFGVRRPIILLLLPILAGIVYQFVFMGLMGLLDPRGELVDLRWLSRLITPGS
ncbi:tripartite tricarboxylate transporter TctB family protein [Hasllibacter sp. MH4015]|uniref:tripartite tricarboxylate transporter TctB family protein n=1 Tax=Hasllibacter sp. MH4015 TaxID=2854029 RepID=UPI001CD35FB1|nr:tripartite tricarboxylate transporter TctB family protein [Hasllibacter sp. MH4015]